MILQLLIGRVQRPRDEVFNHPIKFAFYDEMINDNTHFFNTHPICILYLSSKILLIYNCII